MTVIHGVSPATFRRLFATPLLCLSLVAVACDVATSRTSSSISTAFDSAGVRIIQFDEMPSRRPSWSLHPEPLLLLGESNDTDAVLANPLEALGRADGGLVVRDSYRGFFSLKYFDSEGRLTATSARWGEGPFEFRFPLGVHRLPGDSVLVVGESGRYAVFGPTGEGAREARVVRSTPSGAFRSYYPGRGLVVVEAQVLSRRDTVDFGLVRGQQQFLTRSMWESSVGTHLVAAPYTPGWNRESGGRPNAVWTHRYPFAPLTSAGAGPDRFWLAVADQPEVRAYDLEGGVAIVVRFANPAETVTWWDRRRFKRRVEDYARSDDEEGWAQYLREVEFPKIKPYYGRLEVDRDGNVWIQHFQVEPGDQLWSVFDRSGNWLANFQLPVELTSPCEWNPRRILPCDRIFEIGADYMIIETEGQFGVRRVGKYEILR